MPLLHIALQEGFTGEAVSISVNGREAYRKDRVVTRTQIGRADVVELTLAAPAAAIEIRAGSASASFTVPLAQDLYVAVSLTGDKQIEHRESKQAFGYV